VENHRDTNEVKHTRNYPFPCRSPEFVLAAAHGRARPA